MIDPDDADVISLDFTMRELRVQANRLADPEQAWWAWFEAVLACLVHGQAPGRPITWTMLICARRVVSEIKASL